MAVYFTTRIGSSGGGSPFSHYRGIDGAVVETITVWAATSRIKAIQLTFTDGRSFLCGSPSRPEGEGDLSWKSFTFNRGERITRLSLWGNGAGTRSGWIKFHTDHNRKFSHGMYNWGRKQEFPQQVASGILVGCFGRAGADIDSLGIVFLQPLTSCTLTSLEYPNLHFEGTTAHTTITELSRQSKTIALQNVNIDESSTNDQGLQLQIEMSDKVEFEEHYSKWSLDHTYQIGLFQFWDKNKITVEARIPVLTLFENQIGWTVSSSACKYDKLTPPHFNSSIREWTQSLLLEPTQTTTISARAYSGVVQSLSFNGSLRFTTTNGGSFSFSTSVAGNYDGQTYFYEPKPMDFNYDNFEEMVKMRAIQEAEELSLRKRYMKIPMGLGSYLNED